MLFFLFLALLSSQDNQNESRVTGISKTRKWRHHTKAAVGRNLPIPSADMKVVLVTLLLLVCSTQGEEPSYSFAFKSF